RLHRRVVEAYRKLCFEALSLYRLMPPAPELVNELILKLLAIQPDDDSSFGVESRRFGLEDIRSWYPPFWSHFPWLPFLNEAPTEAISTIVTLMETATSSWERKARVREMEPIGIAYWSGKTERKLRGNEQMFLWHMSGSAPKTAQSPL